MDIKKLSLGGVLQKRVLENFAKLTRLKAYNFIIKRL